jgi:hypothetical protein
MVQRLYGFIAQVAAYRDRATCAGTRQRLDDWLKMFSSQHALRCARQKLQAWQQAHADTGQTQGMLAGRLTELLAAYAEFGWCRLSSTSSWGELAQVVHAERHPQWRRALVEIPRWQYAERTGQALSEVPALPAAYLGDARIIVPVAPSWQRVTHDFELTVLVLAPKSAGLAHSVCLILKRAEGSAQQIIEGVRARNGDVWTLRVAAGQLAPGLWQYRVEGGGGAGKLSYPVGEAAWATLVVSAAPTISTERG